MIFIELFLYLGVFAAGVSGALVGIRKELDLFGVLFLGGATALGGGLARDVMIGRLPPVGFLDPAYFLVATGAGLLTWLFYRRIERLRMFILGSDAIGLGVFTAVGANAALTHGYDEPFIVVSMGLITGIGGGVLRDVFVREIPFVFRKEVYAIASIVGAGTYYFTVGALPNLAAMFLCLVVTFAIRIASIALKIDFPVYKEKK
ncbi:trimeric intracellular cation channel family protein [Paenibacillus sp.]|uniref:trimeric intracellular cation channel family protein n=1 Tax=Paenibacillus sp. TaxID=58172 RepID=UPI002D52391D|nr:trimeric intracellular cation channel family protein [Paenibacillus sp.]HZG56647.1 trimeric intracellular cation channel family protein [Paenibacillus sp.]